MKILVIFTGGTIGSKLNNGWISPDAATKHTLIEQYKSHFDSSVEFFIEEPYSILSENLSADDINLLIKTIGSGLCNDYDGIIVTHGTDTLQYSAAALSFCFGEDTIPIILVSSNLPLDDEKANGHENFSSAVEFIKTRQGKGVFVAYKNKNDIVRFHKGLELLAHREADDSICSINDNDYASVNNGKIEVAGKAESTHTPLGAFELVESPKILVISSYPGDEFAYRLDGYNAVILRPYHSGTLNTSNKKFKTFCESARENNIPVFMVNALPEENYESVKALDELGIIPMLNVPFISLYMRLWIAVSRGVTPISVLEK